MTCCNHACREGRDCPHRLTKAQKFAIAAFIAFLFACAIAIAYGDRAAIPL